MIAQSNTADRAGTIAQAFKGGGLSDWYLPSTDELNQMCKWAFANPWTSDATACSGGTLNLGTGAGLGAAGFKDYYYWSSSELPELPELLPKSAQDQDFFNVKGLKDYGWKDSAVLVRPVRAFASKLSITSLTTNTKAYPYSQALSITTSGGSGSGATTFEIASGGSASGCTLSGPTATETITATTSGTCLIQASKAADSIYSLETSATSIFTFIKATPNLQTTTLFVNMMKKSNDVQFDLGDPGVNAIGGRFTFTSDNLEVATISGRTVTIRAGGSAIITATFTPTDTANYNIATIAMILTVEQILDIG
jgi:hypothetical protein